MRYLLCAVAVFFAGACTAAPEPFCKPLTYAGHDYTVCKASASGDIRLFLNRDSGRPYYSFEAVDAALEGTGGRLGFAMNAGMYHQDRSPVGLFVGAGKAAAPLNTSSRFGNFGLVPNGVFYVADGRPGVAESNAFAASGIAPDYATQSGPMLVIDGALHPAFRKGSTSLKRRNGVGVSGDGAVVWFVISEGVVNFHDFASLFRDYLGTPNALFLDGTVSRLFDPETGRSDPGLAMGPIVGVVIPSAR